MQAEKQTDRQTDRRNLALLPHFTAWPFVVYLTPALTDSCAHVWLMTSNPVLGKAMVTTSTIRTSIRPPFDCTSTAIRPFDDLLYDRPTYCGLLHCGLNK